MFKRGWQHGRARIVARQTSEHGVRKGLNFYAPTGQWNWVYDYVADVQPDGGGTMFRAKFTELFRDDEDHVRRPDVGDETVVRFAPKTHEVEFDRAVLRADAKAPKTARAQQFDAIADAAPGSPTDRGRESGLSGQSSELPTDAEMQAASDAWDAAMAEARGHLEAQAEVKAAGNSSEAARHLREGAVANVKQQQLGEEFKRLRALRPDWKSNKPSEPFRLPPI